LRFLALLVFPWIALCAQDRPQFVWQGEVDGTLVLHINGKRADVQIQEGLPALRQRFNFNDPLPEVRQNARLEVLEGRGNVRIVDQPLLENHYTLTVAIEDLQPGGAFYSIALFWDVSNRSFEGGDALKIGQVTWSGRVDEEAVVSCRAKSCVSSVERGAPVAAEHFKFSRPLPGRNIEVRLEAAQGRGEIRLVEQPRERNHYTAKVSIRDLENGVGEYSFTLVWNRYTGSQAPVAEPAGRGLLWSGTVAGRVRVTVQGGATFSQALGGQPVHGERSELLRPIPASGDLAPAIQKLRGRGKVNIVESPSEKNGYRLVFEIDDPGPGADAYEVQLDY
jgi:hypothetical protein